MKKLIILISFGLSAFVSQSQTNSSTTTQNAALKAFEDAFISTDWTAKTTAEQDAFNRQWTGLKIAAAKEAETNPLASIAAQTVADQAAQTAATTAKNDFIAKLKSLGYLCDNGQPDWRKLYNIPERFGSTYQAKADYQQSISTGIDYFLQQAQSILFIPYEVSKPYKVGDTFSYSGKYYKVIQPHTSQITWVPSSTASLYTEISASGTIVAFKQPTGAQDAYKKGDKVTYNGLTYQSLIDNNVWSPDAYPSGWSKI